MNWSSMSISENYLFTSFLHTWMFPACCFLQRTFVAKGHIFGHPVQLELARVCSKNLSGPIHFDIYIYIYIYIKMNRSTKRFRTHSSEFNIYIYIYIYTLLFVDLMYSNTLGLYHSSLLRCNQWNIHFFHFSLKSCPSVWPLKIVIIFFPLTDASNHALPKESTSQTFLTVWNANRKPRKYRLPRKATNNGEWFISVGNQANGISKIGQIHEGENVTGEPKREMKNGDPLLSSPWEIVHNSSKYWFHVIPTIYTLETEPVGLNWMGRKKISFYLLEDFNRDTSSPNIPLGLLVLIGSEI